MKNTVAILAIAAAVAGTTASAQNFENAVKARQGMFQILAINLGILGGMARGNTEYDAETAAAAAQSIVGVSMIVPSPLFPAGSSEMDIDGTRAKAEIWDNIDDVVGKWEALGTAAQTLPAAAAEGPAAIGAALGGVGGTCKACHDAYRAPQS